jgi:uncharacterized protein (DUF2062 family)
VCHSPAFGLRISASFGFRCNPRIATREILSLNYLPSSETVAVAAGIFAMLALFGSSADVA